MLISTRILYIDATCVGAGTTEVVQLTHLYVLSWSWHLTAL